MSIELRRRSVRVVWTYDRRTQRLNGSSVSVSVCVSVTLSFSVFDRGDVKQKGASAVFF